MCNRSVFLEKTTEMMDNPITLGRAFLALAVFLFVLPEPMFIAGGAGIAIIVAVLFYSDYKKILEEQFPFRAPVTSDSIDYNDPKPGRRGFNQAAGTFFVGNITNTPGKVIKEAWLSAKDVLSNIVVFGPLGATKTEALLSLAFNAIASGSGLSFIDSLGSSVNIHKLYQMVRLCGRDDDFRCLDFTYVERKNYNDKVARRSSSTIDIFSYGSVELLANLLNSLIPKSEGGNALFSTNARHLMESVMGLLVEMRDLNEIKLSPTSIRTHLSLSKVIELAERNDLSLIGTSKLKDFLASIGYKQAMTESENKALAEQFGYARSYFGEPLNNLTDTYRDIFGATSSEIDLCDVIANRRILITYIPSICMATEEKKSLSIISFLATCAAIEAVLKNKSEHSSSTENSSTENPFLFVIDDYVSIRTPDFINSIALGRGAGVAFIVSSQEQLDPDKSHQPLRDIGAKCIIVTGNHYMADDGIALGGSNECLASFDIKYGKVFSVSEHNAFGDVCTQLNHMPNIKHTDIDRLPTIA